MSVALLLLQLLTFKKVGGRDGEGKKLGTRLQEVKREKLKLSERG